MKIKKQYLISLLGLIAISIPLGKSLLNITNSSSIALANKTNNTGITIEDDSEAFFIDTNRDGKANKGDQLDSIIIDVTYDSALREDNLEPINTNTDKLHFYYPTNSATSNSIDLSYEVINDYATKTSGWGYVGDKEKGTFYASINSVDDLFNELDIWNYKLIDSKPFDVTTDVSDVTNEGDSKDSYEKKIGSINLFVPFDTGIEIKNISNATFIDENKNNELDSSDTLESITVYASFDKSSQTTNLKIKKNDELHFYYGRSEGSVISLTYKEIYMYLSNDESGRYLYFNNSERGFFYASINSIDNKDLIIDNKKIWNYKIANSNPINVTTDATYYDNGVPIEKDNIEIGQIQLKIIENEAGEKNESKQFRGWIIFGIILGLLFLLGTITGIGYVWFREHKANKISAKNKEKDFKRV